MPAVVLEVAVSDPRDVPGAAGGGADRLHLALPGPTCSLSPEPALVSAVCHESDLPVFVLLRLNDTWSTTGGEFARLIGLAEDYLGCGATGVAFGFLDADLEIDTETVTMLLDRLPAVPWTFTRAVDSSLDPRRSWRRLLAAPSAGRRALGGVPARHVRGLRGPAGDDHPGERPARHARRRPRRRARALAAPGRRAAAPPRCPGPARVVRRRPTSTPPTSGRGDPLVDAPPVDAAR